MNKGIYTRVSNRCTPTPEFITIMVAWMKQAPDRLFERTASSHDIYTKVFRQLGPWPTGEGFMLFRRAVMCEVLRVLGAFESSYNWTMGYDKHNPDEDTIQEMSAGIFQISYDSCGNHPELKLILHEWGIFNATDFRKAMMHPTNHDFVFEYTVQLLRLNVAHNGPILRGEINPWLSRAAVSEFEALLAS